MSRWAEIRRFLLAELRQLTTISPSDRRWQIPFAAALATGLPIIEARFYDTVLGCVVGVIGGIFLHNTTIRSTLSGQLRRLVPARFVRESAPPLS